MMQRGTPPKFIYHSSVTWSFQNVFYRWPDVNNTIESREFETKFDVPVKWRLTLCVSQIFDEEYKTVIYLRGHQSCDKPRSRCIRAILEFTDITGEKHACAIGQFVYNSRVELVFNFPLIENHITSYFQRTLNDLEKFTIKCDLFLDTSSNTWTDPGRDLLLLSSDLDTFYLAGNLTDLILHVGHEKFHVHSAIVKLRSPYVADELAKTPGKQDVSFKGKCSGNQLKNIIRYWYSGDFYKVPRYKPSEVPSFVEEMKQQELKPYLSREEISMISTFEQINISLNWTIEDDHSFARLETMENKVATAPPVQQSWKLHFYPKGETGKSGNISLCVEEEGDITSNCPAYLKIFFKDKEGNEHGSNNIIWMLKSASKYVFHDVLSHHKFNEMLPTLLWGKKLSIECRIQYGTGECECKFKPKVVSNPESVEAIKHPYEVLAGNLKDLLKNKETSDVTLKTKDGEELRAHSAILAARSRSFELDLRDPESHVCKTGVIELPDVESNDLNLILKYMYHAEIELDLALARKLYPAVRKYKIKGLENLCSKRLQSHLNVDCALEVLGMADTSKDLSLRKTSLEFNVRNFGEISMTEKWQNFLNANPKLASEIEDQRRLFQSNSE